MLVIFLLSCGQFRRMVSRALGVRGTGKESNFRVIPFCCAHFFVRECCLWRSWRYGITNVFWRNSSLTWRKIFWITPNWSASLKEEMLKQDYGGLSWFLSQIFCSVLNESWYSIFLFVEPVEIHHILKTFKRTRTPLGACVSTHCTIERVGI